MTLGERLKMYRTFDVSLDELIGKNENKMVSTGQEKRNNRIIQ